MKLLSKDKLQKLTTSRLLAYKNALLKVPETPNWYEDTSMSKMNPKWIETYTCVKEILSSRKHIEEKK